MPTRASKKPGQADATDATSSYSSSAFPLPPPPPSPPPRRVASVFDVRCRPPHALHCMYLLLRCLHSLPLFTRLDPLFDSGGLDANTTSCL